MNDIPWNKIILEEFKRLAFLTDDEILILNDWVVGKSVTFTSMHMCMSIRSVNSTRKSIRGKYDSVQKHSDILPIRKRPHL